MLLPHPALVTRVTSTRRFVLPVENIKVLHYRSLMRGSMEGWRVDFPPQRANHAESVSMPWRHYGNIVSWCIIMNLKSEWLRPTSWCFSKMQSNYSGNWLCPWWRHQMEIFSALLAICAGNSPVTGEFPAQKPVTRSFDVLFDMFLNKRLCKQSWGCDLRRHRAHCDVNFNECHGG